MGVIGVDLRDVISGREPRRRGPRKKRQTNKREQQLPVRDGGLRAAPSTRLLPAEAALGVTYAGLPE